MTGVTREKGISTCTSPHQEFMGQKIHGAPLASSTSFVREQEMNVYMKN
jgi:hypothetical protein